MRANNMLFIIYLNIKFEILSKIPFFSLLFYYTHEIYEQVRLIPLTLKCTKYNTVFMKLFHQ